MRLYWTSVVTLLFVLQPFRCLSQESLNLVVLPDPLFGTHHIGGELALSKNSRLGMMAAYKKDSSRPTYGESNDNVTNTFSRLLVPWIYSKNGSWEDSFFVTGLTGLENDSFTSTAGSRAEATFINLGILGGYQWFWKNGFNISATAGVAFLIETSSKKDISADESSEVIDYLDKNTQTNVHPAAGMIFGWAF